MLPILLVGILLLTLLPIQLIPNVSAATTFQNGFETGDFSGWSGTHVSTGETVNVVTTHAHHGLCSGRFYSNGNGDYEAAYCYKSVAAYDEIWTRCYVYVTQSGINSIGDRIFFTVLRSGSDNVIYAGWKMDVDGKIKWCLTINTGLPLNPSYQDRWYVTTYNPDGPPQQPSPVLNRWYCVEVDWRRGLSPTEGGPYAFSGNADLYVDGVWAVNIGRYDVEMQYYNPVSSVRFGLAEQYGCSASIVYCDCCAIGTTRIGIQGPIPKILSFSASPNPFTPDDDAVNDYTVINAAFNTAVHWQLEVTDASGQIYFSHYSEGRGLSLNFTKWTDGLYLVDGTYTAILSISDVLDRNPSSQSIRIIVHHVRPIMYSWVSLTEFSPLPRGDTCLFYALSESCYVTVRVYDAAGSWVRTLQHNVFLPSGYDYYAVWDGRSSSGAAMPQGDYQFRLSVIKIVNSHVMTFIPDIYWVKIVKPSFHHFC